MEPPGGTGGRWIGRFLRPCGAPVRSGPPVGTPHAEFFRHADLFHAPFFDRVLADPTGPIPHRPPADLDEKLAKLRAQWRKHREMFMTPAEALPAMPEGLSPRTVAGSESNAETTIVQWTVTDLEARVLLAKKPGAKPYVPAGKGDPTNDEAPPDESSDEA